MAGYIIESLGLRLNKSILTISQTLILFVVCYMYNVYVFFSLLSVYGGQLYAYIVVLFMCHFYSIFLII